MKGIKETNRTNEIRSLLIGFHDDGNRDIDCIVQLEKNKCYFQFHCERFRIGNSTPLAKNTTKNIRHKPSIICGKGLFQ